MEQHPAPSFWKSPFGIGATLVALAASAYLFWAHADHVLALLPLVALAACPLMHMFMHRGHRHHPPSANSRADDEPARD